MTDSLADRITAGDLDALDELPRWPKHYPIVDALVARVRTLTEELDAAWQDLGHTQELLHDLGLWVNEIEGHKDAAEADARLLARVISDRNLNTREEQNARDRWLAASIPEMPDDQLSR